MLILFSAVTSAWFTQLWCHTFIVSLTSAWFTQLWCHNCPEPRLHSALMSQLSLYAHIWSCTFGYKAVLSNLIYGHKWGMPSPNMGILYSYDMSNLRTKGTMRYAQRWSLNLELTLSTVMSQLSTPSCPESDCRYCMPKYGDPVVQSNRSSHYAHCPYLGMPHLWS